MKTGQCGDQDQKEAVVNAFAQCATTLELIPSHESSIAHLARALPVDDKGGIIDARDSGIDAVQPRDDYFADLAFSAGELETAWVEICGFEHEGQAWRPDPAVLLALWKTILTNVTANGLDLEKRILIEELMAFAVEDGYKEELLHAVVLRLRSDMDNATHQCKQVFEHAGLKELTIRPGTTIDRATCVKWVGTLILQSRAATDGIPESLLLSEWRNQLPEPWRQYAELELLKVCLPYVTHRPTTNLRRRMSSRQPALVTSCLRYRVLASTASLKQAVRRTRNWASGMRNSKAHAVKVHVVPTCEPDFL